MKIMMNSGRVSQFFTTRMRLIDSIQKAGWDVTVTGYEAEKKNLCDEHNTGFFEIPFARAGLNPISDLKALRLYESVMKKERFDIVHSYTIKPNIYGSIAAKRAGVKGIYPTVNGLGYSFTNKENASFKFRLVQAVVSHLYKKAFSCATKVFFQNADDAGEMVRRGIVDKSKCVVISGSGIDLERFPYSQAPMLPMKFLLATRLLITKGVRTYFEAAKIVKEKYPEAVFELAGGLDPNPDGIKKEELDSYTADGTITYLGHVDDMVKALTECSVFVLPSYYREGVPHAILEAMSTGRAIISTQSPGCRETVRNVDGNGKGLNGFLIEPKNSAQLADTMIWMIEHPQEVKQMGMESRKYAQERFDVEKVNRIMMESMGIQHV